MDRNTAVSFRIPPNRMTLGLLSAAFVLFGSGSEIASAQIRPPQSGFIWDASLRAIRPVLGLPGAWGLGNALDLGMPVLGARFVSGKDFALIVTDQNPTESDGNPIRIASVTGLGSGTIAVVPVVGALAADLLALNDTGTAALLYNRSERIVQWLQGLPNNPTVTRTISLSDFPGDVTVLAVNRSGDLSLIGLDSGDSGSLYRIPVDGDVRWVGNIRAASIVFAANDRDAFLTDSAAGSLMIAEDGQGLSLLAGSASGLEHPGALRIVAGTQLLIASTTASSLTCFDIAHGMISQAALPLPMLQIEPFGTDSLFLLNQPGSGPIYVLDGSFAKDGGCEPVVLFIPPDQSPADPSASTATTPQ